MEGFKIAIPNNKQKGFQLVTGMLLMMNALTMGYMHINATTSVDERNFLIGVIASLFGLSGIILGKRIPILKSVKPQIALFIAALIWFISGNFWIGILMVACGLFASFADRTLYILVNENGIVYPSLPKKTFAWQDVDNCLMKNGVFTLNLKNNHLVQFIASNPNSIDEDSFNAFCAKKTSETN